jgi:hypothetical protein
VDSTHDPWNHSGERRHINGINGARHPCLIDNIWYTYNSPIDITLITEPALLMNLAAREPEKEALYMLLDVCFKCNFIDALENPKNFFPPLPALSNLLP